MALISKRVAIGVTGGIAAYKACELVRELKKLGAEVRVTMTESARQFVTDLSFATLSENPVLTSLFNDLEKRGTIHIDLARWCDAFVICPATANFIGKVAGGIADDVVSTSVMATKSQVIFCPAMNSVMWENPIVQNNIVKLRDLGYDFVEPEWGALATQAEGEGWGRLAAITSIVEKLKYILLGSRELQDRKVLITAGPTREPLDPVRFISNYSSGKMGFALVEAAKLKGAEVTLISGPNNLSVFEGIKYIEIETTAELKKAMESEYQGTDILVMAAAVSDYKPRKAAKNKIKKSDSELTLELQKTPDILEELGERKENCFHIGFALETENDEANAIKKLHSKNLDMVVLNNPLQPGAAFGGDTNVVAIISKDEPVQRLSKMSKMEIAEIILSKAVKMMNQREHKAKVV